MGKELVMENNRSFAVKFSNYMKNTKTSTHVYRASLIAILVIGIIATAIIYNYLDNLFLDYEDSRPKYLAKEYFEEIFDSNDYSLIHNAIGLDSSSPVSKEEFDLWFNNLIKDKELRYAETSAGLSGNSKYYIYLDDLRIGEFLLITTGIKNQSNFDILAKDKVTLSLPSDDAYIIRVRQGSTVFVNGVELSQKYVTEEGNLISGPYTIYTVNYLVNKPTISVKFEGEECYMINPEGNARVYTDEVLNDPISTQTVTTIRAIKGHSVYADGKLLSPDMAVEGAGGKFDGYFFGGDCLEYLVYSYTGEVKQVVIKDEKGKERQVNKIAGGNIYTDGVIGKKGTLEFMALSDSIPTLDSLAIDSKYIIEKEIPTDSCKYMYGNVKGISYNKYKIEWVGDTPNLAIKNKYGHAAVLNIVDGILTEEIEYDSVGLETHGPLITNASHMYVKMMANDANERETLKFFDPAADIYALVRDNPQGYFTAHDSYEFIDSKVKDVYVYDENTFSGSISFVFTVTRNGKVTKYPFDYTFYFRMVNGKYLIYNMINNG